MNTPGTWIADTAFNTLNAVLWKKRLSTRVVRLTSAASQCAVLLGLLLFEGHYVPFAFDLQHRRALTCNSLDWSSTHQEALLVVVSRFEKVLDDSVPPSGTRPGFTTVNFEVPRQVGGDCGVFAFYNALWLGGLVPFPLHSNMAVRMREIMAATLLSRGIPGFNSSSANAEAQRGAAAHSKRR